MDVGTHEQLVLLALLAAVAGLLTLVPYLRLPYPILLVVGGLALGFVPGLPHPQLPPDLVLVGVLPPLLYSATFFTSLRDLRAKVGAISFLSIGAVLATVFAVAWVGHDVVGLGWAASFVLGAVVAPTDPLAATEIARRLGVPRRIVTTVEGESLINDASALAVYRVAVVAVVSGAFSVAHAGAVFVGSVLGGIAVGLVVAWVVAQVRIRLDYIPAEIAISLLTGYFAYIPAAALHVSGVLAAVTAGVYLGWRSPELSTPAMRLQAMPVWETLIFLTNSLLFVLVGLQLRPIWHALQGSSKASLIGYAAAVAATVIAVRLASAFALLVGSRFVFGRHRDEPGLWKFPALIGWMGMRGAVSLAAALALPLRTDAGAPFPGRSLIVFLTFAVILVTLIAQGLTLPPLIQALRLEDDGLEAREEAKARIRAADAALERIDELVGEAWVRDDTAERMRGLYRFRRNRFSARFDSEDDGSIEARSADYQRLRRELLEAERRAVVELRRNRIISDEVMHKVERDLDLEDGRLDV
jgi:CPA1 family monovalent cation:H+ antiporter